MTHPLLDPSSLPLEALPFDQIHPADFGPAIEKSLALAREALERVAARTDRPTFENTIEALESCSEALDRVSGVFSNYLHANTDETLQTLAKTVMPKLADFSNDIFLDSRLFARVLAVHEEMTRQGESPAENTMTRQGESPAENIIKSRAEPEHLQDANATIYKERKRLLEKTYKAFARNGALLSDEKKKQLREIDQKLSVAGQQYSDQLLKSTNEFELWIMDEKDLAGLPENVREAAAAAGQEKKKSGWLFTLQYPSYGPFLEFSERRELRQKLWFAYQTRATTGANDNRPLIREIAHLRRERAKQLGYSTHADFVLEERMASNPKTVRAFLDRLLAASREAAERDLAELRRIAGRDLGELQPWDVAIYSRKLMQEKYDFDEELLRPYFKLEFVIEGVFEHARRLYGLLFKRRTDIPVYHPDVQAFEVLDEKSGVSVGLFYADFFPRESKQGGAWMTTFREQGMWHGVVKRPHVSIVCNFTKPTPTKPSLLSLDEVRTLFHEFGHSLHALLSQCRYRSLSGANVYWDFVELPSQIMENWVKEKESLDIFARHYETGERIPAEYVKKIQETAKFQAGWFSLRQLNFGFLDLAWHADDLPEIHSLDEVEKYETEVMKRTSLFPHVPGTVVSCGFSHIFSGGYSAGYYSYKWAEVLDADAFEFFKEKGIFSHEVSDRFKNHILSRGGTEHPMELYKRFRGREPDPNALLRRDGLIEP